MSDYESYADLAHHIDEEGLHYFWTDYTTPEDVTVSGEPLPAVVIETIKVFTEAGDRLEKFFEVSA